MKYIKKTNWSKTEIENNLAKSGMLANAYLPVIKGVDLLIPVWNLREYDFLFSNNMHSVFTMVIIYVIIKYLNGGNMEEEVRTCLIPI